MRKTNFVLTAVLCAATLALVSGCSNNQEPKETESEALESIESESYVIEFETDAEKLEWEDETEEEQEPYGEPEYNPEEYVTVGDISNIVLEVPEVTAVTDEDVEEYIDYEMEYANAYETIDKKEVEEGDMVDIDFVGKIDGEEFDGGSAENFYLEIGSETFIDGFEDQLIGAKVGDTVDVAVTFPEDYYEELAGKDAVFETTVNGIVEKRELDDELAKEISEDENATAESYRESVRKQLEESAEMDDKYEQQMALEDKLGEIIEVSGYPEDVINERIEAVMGDYDAYAESIGSSIDDVAEEMFGISPDELRAQSEEEAKDALRIEMGLLAIAKENDLLPTGDELEERLEQQAKDSYYDSLDEMLTDYSRSYLEKMLARQLAEDFLLENAEIKRVEQEDYEEISDDDFIIDFETEEGDDDEFIIEFETEEYEG